MKGGEVLKFHRPIDAPDAYEDAAPRWLTRRDLGWMAAGAVVGWGVLIGAASLLLWIVRGVFGY